MRAETESARSERAVVLVTMMAGRLPNAHMNAQRAAGTRSGTPTATELHRRIAKAGAVPELPAFRDPSRAPHGSAERVDGPTHVPENQGFRAF